MNEILVTGANGFIGRRLCDELIRQGRTVRRAVRTMDGLSKIANHTPVGDINGNTEWTEALDGVVSVVHLAARAHVLKDTMADPLSEFRRVNVEGTLNLARQAAATGVRRFVFISSIGVNGVETFSKAFVADDKPAPHSAYAISKHEAELGLMRIAEEAGLDVVVIRPPLVYGPRAPGNFKEMMRFLYNGIPLPLGSIRNKRSLVALDNLVSLILTCLHHRNAANQTFLVSDGEDVSTPQLLRRLGQLLGKKTYLIPVPLYYLKFIGAVFGKQDMMQKLYGSLQVDISKTRELLSWSPPITVDKGLRLAVDDFIELENSGELHA